MNCKVGISDIDCPNIKPTLKTFPVFLTQKRGYHILYSEIMLIKFFILFISVPLIELYLLFEVGKLIGLLNTILLVVITGMIGGYLAKREGLSCLSNIREKLDSGFLPGSELLDAGFILASGALLITPGIITDALGFLGLTPFSRRFLKRWIKKKFKKSFATKINKGTKENHISVEYEVKD